MSQSPNIKTLMLPEDKLTLSVRGSILNRELKFTNDLPQSLRLLSLRSMKVCR